MIPFLDRIQQPFAPVSDDDVTNKKYVDEKDADVSAAMNAAVAAKAPLDSPAFTGSPTAPTPAATDNSTKLATTAYVTAKVAGSSSSSSFPTPTTAAGVGQWCTFTNRLPAGGTWAYGGTVVTIQSNYYDGSTVTSIASVSGTGGVSAGGSNVYGRSSACTGFCWRIA